MTPEQWSTTRRLLVTLLAPLFALGAKKWGFEISDFVMGTLDIVFASYVLGSNLKEALKHRANVTATATVQAAKLQGGGQ